MAIHRGVLTYEDYLATPNNGCRYEIHDGELSVTPAPGTRHQMVSANLGDALRGHIKQLGLGLVLYAPLAVVLSNTTVVEPDIVYIATADAARVSARGIEGPPTLAIEIISPNTPRIDRVTKLQLYARHDVPYYWIVDPDARAIDVYELAEGGYRLVTRASGDAPVSPAPFTDLALVPDSLWP